MASWLDFQPILAGLAVQTAAGNYTISAGAGVIVKKTVGAATTVNLPKISATENIIQWIIDGKGDAAANNITIDGYGAETINGAATLVISTNYGAVALVSDGTEWKVWCSAAVAAGGTPTFTTLTVTGATSLAAVASTGRDSMTLANFGPAPTDTYAATMTLDVTKSSHIIAGVSGTSATVAFTPSAAGTAGDLLTILTSADASGTVTATFASTFHPSATQVTTASHFSTITFQSDGTRWLELCRTTNLA